MPRRPSPVLTAAEQRLMEVLWERGPGTVKEVLEALEEPLAYNSVLTTLRILEKKGFVRHRKRGRAFVYKPRVDRQAARRSAVRELIGRFFDGSAESLVVALMRDEALTPEEIERLRELSAERARSEEDEA